MAIGAEDGRALGAAPAGSARAPLERLATASLELAAEGASQAAFDLLAESVARATGADVALVRVTDEDASALVTRAVWARSPVDAAQLAGSRLAYEDHAPAETAVLDRLTPAGRRLADRLRMPSILNVPVRIAGQTRASLELLRAGPPFDPLARDAARLAAGQLGLLLRALGESGDGRGGWPREALEVAGDALAAGSDERTSAAAIARLATRAAGAAAALLWRADARDRLRVVTSFGLEDSGVASVAVADEAAARALLARRPVTVEEGPLSELIVSIQLGQPPLGVLQLLFAAGTAPEDGVLEALTTFGARAAHSLRTATRSRAVAGELELTRALLGIVAQAFAQLSLTHTLDVAVERIAQLLGVDRVAVYLRDDGRLVAAAERALAGPHARVAERLLKLALGPFRGRGMVVVPSADEEERLADVADAVAEAGLESLVAVPLLVHDEVIGLLAAYGDRGYRASASEATLLAALASQLAVAVQNARLHERATTLGRELEEALSSERQAARQLRTLYEISRAFAQSLSLETTLDAVAQTVVDLLEVDAALIRMPDERRETLVARALHVGDPVAGRALGAVLARPLPFDKLPLQRLFRTREPLALDAERAASLGEAESLLVPFLEKGSTAVMLPVATPAEVLGTLTLVSLDAARPIAPATVETALSVAGQAALAIDNARLYQQQKDFSDTMQRSLLPRTRPDVLGLELGEVYESSARVEVGGDVYDFLILDDGRLAVTLGDVTGHGIEAAADMAMVKFVFRSLMREHSEPARFLAAANEVVVDEVAPGKFVTMVLVTIDGGTGRFACASAGHPPPRLVHPGGTVEPVAARGLALGVEGGQVYDEVEATLPPAGSLVLFTDGVLEARRDGVMYGEDRLDATLSRNCELPAKELARAVLADTRAFAGGELNDDCALVVIKRAG